MAEPEVSALFRVLSDPTRLRIVELLSEAPRRAGELAADVGLPAASMSRHLRILLETGVVIDRRLRDDARARVFELHAGSVTAARAWLDQIQAHWDEQLAAFQRHVEHGSRS